MDPDLILSPEPEPYSKANLQHDLEKIFEMTIAYAIDVADAERCFLFVVDELNGTLVLVGNNSENSNQKQGIALMLVELKTIQPQ